MASERNRLLELDVLRGCAAAAVALFHYTVRYQQLYGFRIAPDVTLPHGALGVEFFFCISGFVIFMTLERTRRPMDFVVSRFSRLWPAYIAAMVLTFTAVHLIGLPGRSTTFVQALINLTMFQEMLHVPDVDVVYWSLQVELIFYCWMFTAYCTGMLAHMRVVLCLALLPPLAYFAAQHYFHHELSYLAGQLLLVRYAPYFVIGISAYNLYIRRPHAQLDLALMAAAVLVIYICMSTPEAAIALFACLVFCALALGRLHWIARGPFIFLGSISYTFYLVHQNIGYIVIRAASERGVPPDLAIALALVVTVLLATLLTRTVERPARSWIREVYGRYLKSAAGRGAGAVATAE